MTTLYAYFRPHFALNFPLVYFQGFVCSLQTISFSNVSNMKNGRIQLCEGCLKSIEVQTASVGRVSGNRTFRFPALINRPLKTTRRREGREKRLPFELNI